MQGAPDHNKNITQNFKTLSAEYTSFDLLWFDIESRTRFVLQELLEPIINELVAHQETISTVKENSDHVRKTVYDLRDVFYAKDKKLDVFEKINMRLAEGEA